MPKVMVLGAGRVGRVIARDLASDPAIQVAVTDRRTGYLDELAEALDITVVAANLGDPAALADAVSGYDLVVGALPGALGYTAVQGVIGAGKNYVDISFMPEDPRVLFADAEEAGVTVLYDFGVAPGMSNLIAAREAMRLAPARHISIMVGGLPRKRTHPWEYVAPFSPADVIEEYVRPARIKSGGKAVSRPPLSGLEYVDIPGIGTLEAFHSDGLRSLVDTVDCPSMEEKTLRYPGHRDRIKLLSEAGFFDTDPIDIDGVAVRPRQVSLRLLENAWQMDDDSDEFTVMRISIIGGEGPTYTKANWSLLDNTDRTKRETSMARTTGFPASIAARRMLDGTISLGPGVYPPESLAGDDAFFFGLLEELEKRGVFYLREAEQTVQI
jgi:lysine 6-dehydrogenase